MPRYEAPVKRLSPKEALILRLLEDAPRYGLELVEAAQGDLKRGTVYVTLGRMEEKSLIASHQEGRSSREGGLPLRIYRLTPRGKQLLEAWTAFEESIENLD